MSAVRSFDAEFAQVRLGQFDKFGSLPGQDGPGGVQREAPDLTQGELGRQRQLKHRVRHFHRHGHQPSGADPGHPLHGHPRCRAAVNGHVPHLSPHISDGNGGNTDIRQLVKGARLQLPVYAEGAKFSADDGHMAQGDGEVAGTVIETLMAVTLRFSVIKNTIIASLGAIVPAADPASWPGLPTCLPTATTTPSAPAPGLMENAKSAVRGNGRLAGPRPSAQLA